MADLKVKVGLGEKNSAAASLIRQRMLAHSETMKALLPKMRARAVAVAGIEDMEVLNRVRRECAKVPEGKDWREARKKIAKLIAGGDDPSAMKRRAELVLRTNCETARAAAHWENIKKEKDVFPYLMYETMRDGSVRPSHKTLDGMILPADDPFWKTHYPPWDWGCRCTVIQIDKEMRDELCKSGIGRVMSEEAKQDFKAMFGNEKHTFEFDPDGFGDFSKMGLPEEQLRDMHDALVRDTPGNTVRNERNEEENAWEFLWRTGPQAEDNETLRKELFKDSLRRERVIVRDAATGEILEKTVGGESAVETDKDWYRKGLPGKVRTTHIHTDFNPVPSPTDVLTALEPRSEAETVITENTVRKLIGLPEAKNRRNIIARQLAEMENGDFDEKKWEEWLKGRNGIIHYEEERKK